MKLIFFASLIIVSSTLAVAQNQSKTESKAVRLAVLNTVVPIGLGTYIGFNKGAFLGDDFTAVGAVLSYYGLVLGPSLGHFYCNNNRRALNGALLRSATIGATFLIGLKAYPKHHPSDLSKYDNTIAILIAGHAVCLLLDGLDILSVKKSFRENKSDKSFGLLPYYCPVGTRAALVLSASF